MKPTVLASLPLVTVWLTVSLCYLNCCVSTSSAELVTIDVVNSARCHVRCLSLTQVKYIFNVFYLMNLVAGKINKAYVMLGVIKRNFKYLKTSSFILLYKNMVRSHLDYCNSVWSPYRKRDMEDIEKVQKEATKLIPELKRMNYTDSLTHSLLRLTS